MEERNWKDWDFDPAGSALSFSHIDRSGKIQSS
jgi:hypothetical protein